MGERGRHEDEARAVRAAALEGEGHLGAAQRQAAAAGEGLGGAAAVYVDKIHRHAHRVTDADVAALKGEGYTEDQIFELTVAAAVGAGMRRLDAGLAAIRGGKR